MTTETTPKLIAFHGQQDIKDKYLDRVRKHREADQLIQGYGYWSDGKGCAVGCTLHSNQHGAYEPELGIPVALAYLEDRLFERLPIDLARTWPERFLAAPRVGADLNFVPHQFAIWLLTSPDSLYQQVVTDAEAKDIFSQLACLYERVIHGDKPTDAEWVGLIQRASEKAWKAYYDARALDLDLDQKKKFFGLASEKLLSLMAEAPIKA